MPVPTTHTLYGASAADFVATGEPGGALTIPSSTVNLTVWSAATGGTQITDLYSEAEAAVTTVSTDAFGNFRFYAPSASGTVWVQAPDAGGKRYSVQPVNVGSRVIAAEASVPAATAAQAAAEASGDLALSANAAAAAAAADAAALSTALYGEDGKIRTELLPFGSIAAGESIPRHRYWDPAQQTYVWYHPDGTTRTGRPPVTGHVESHGDLYPDAGVPTDQLVGDVWWPHVSRIQPAG